MFFKRLGAKPAGARLHKILQSPNFYQGAFRNYHPTTVMRSPTQAPATVTDLVTSLTSRSQVKPSAPLPVVKSDLHALGESGPEVVWFGHSSYLIAHRGRRILVDPIFSKYASPVPGIIRAFGGTHTYRVEDLPEIDLLVITHDHYDHLDYETVRALRTKVKAVCTSLGVGAHLEHWGYDGAMIAELDWWEGARVMGDVQITATPARHFSGRGLKRGRTLWSSFVLDFGGKRFFIGGDSGYGAHFAEIGKRFGPFDLAFVECGQYNEGWPLIHAFPEQSATAGRELGAKWILPTHWAKFSLSFHPWSEPAERVCSATAELGLTCVTPRIGEVLSLEKAPLTEPWWREVLK